MEHHKHIQGAREHRPRGKHDLPRHLRSRRNRRARDNQPDIKNHQQRRGHRRVLWMDHRRYLLTSRTNTRRGRRRNVEQPTAKHQHRRARRNRPHQGDVRRRHVNPPHDTGRWNRTLRDRRRNHLRRHLQQRRRHQAHRREPRPGQAVALLPDGNDGDSRRMVQQDIHLRPGHERHTDDMPLHRGRRRRGHRRDLAGKPMRCAPSAPRSTPPAHPHSSIRTTASTVRPSPHSPTNRWTG